MRYRHTRRQRISCLYFNATTKSLTCRLRAFIASSEAVTLSVSASAMAGCVCTARPHRCRSVGSKCTDKQRVALARAQRRCLPRLSALHSCQRCDAVTPFLHRHSEVDDGEQWRFVYQPSHVPIRNVHVPRATKASPATHIGTLARLAICFSRFQASCSLCTLPRPARWRPLSHPAVRSSPASTTRCSRSLTLLDSVKYCEACIQAA